MRTERKSKSSFLLSFNVLENKIPYMLDLTKLSYPLPDDVENARKAGCIELTEILIERYLNDDSVPRLLKDRLLLEKHNINVLKRAFPYTIEEADKLLANEYPGEYIPGSISKLLTDGKLAWIIINGKMMVEERVLADAARVLSLNAGDHGTQKDLNRRDTNIAYMIANKERSARIKLRTSIKPKTGFGMNARINLPVVRPAHSVSDIKFISASSGFVSVDPETCLMRSARFEKELTEGDEFFIEYEYTITAHHRNIGKTSEPIDKKTFSEYLSEQAPHIIFTPYLKALEKEITYGITSPSEKARAIYNWITTHVKYSYMRPYKTICNIPEFAAANLKGDCGVQALLFITLCRISGIPAKWQSGLYVTEDDASPHDWAEFYLPEYGWCFADCSFGGGGFRQGNDDRWHYYFGSDDVYRLPANDGCCLGLYGKKHYAADPTDNQRGEIETDERALDSDEVECKTEVLSFNYLGAK